MLQGVLEWYADPANWQGEDGLLNRLVEHSLLTVTATLVAALVGLPIALWLGHVGKGGVLAINISNVGRAVPTFAVLLLLALGPVGSAYFGPYGRAGAATLVALVLFALPPIITNAYVGMREVDRDTVEAARGRIVTLGFVRQDVPQVVGGALVIAVIALLLEVALVGVQSLIDPVARARRTAAAVARSQRSVTESM